jgi:hypothetical protein
MTITDRRYGILAGVAMKAPCKLATTANITLSGHQSIDGTTTVDDDRILVMDQTDTTENGIYVASSDTWSRATDFDSGDEMVDGTMVFVTDGSVNVNGLFRLSVSGDVTIDTTALAFDAVATAASVAVAAEFGDGTESAPSITNVGDTNTGLFFPAAEEVGVTITASHKTTFDATGFKPATSDAYQLGSATKMWSDLFMASGAVLNFNAGDVTITHSANALAFAGGAVSFDNAPVPATDDGAALGSTSLKWADLFLASLAVINFNSGDVTLTHGPNSLTIAGGRFVTAAVTANDPGLQLTAGTVMTTPAAGAIEMDSNCMYGTTDAGNRGYIPLRHFIRCDSAKTLTSTTSEQALFDSPANGTLTLETGTYLFEGLLYITSMSATSGNAAIDLLGAGTATAASWLWSAQGVDATDPTAAAAQLGSFAVTQQSVASIVTAATGTALALVLKGTFEITGAGTLIPSISLVTAAAASVNIGSCIIIERIGSTSVASVGQWS